MTRILILFAHPTLEKSRSQVHLLEAVQDLKHVLVHDLYETMSCLNEADTELAVVECHPALWA